MTRNYIRLTAMMEKEQDFMICGQDRREKMEMLVNVLLSFFTIFLNMMKLLVTIFVITLFAVPTLKSRAAVLCQFLYSKYGIRYSSFEGTVFNY